MNEDADRIEGLDRLTRVRVPSRDLWPGIAARLATRRRSRYGLVQFALAASLVAGMGAMFTVAQQQPGTAGGVLTASQTVGDHHSRAIVEANLSIVKQAERELRQALKKHPESAPLRSLLASTENRARDLRAML